MGSYIKEDLIPGYKGKFVIQLHHAKRAGDHFDLRLSFPVSSLKNSLKDYQEKRTWGDNGTTEPRADIPDKKGLVLRSWAIPKHKLPTDSPLLAQETENHIMSYGSFRGTIPEGYGAGKVDIWDKGTYEMVDVEYDKKYVFRMHGSKAKGYYALVKTGSGKQFIWNKVKNIDKYEKTTVAEILRRVAFLFELFEN